MSRNPSNPSLPFPSPTTSYWQYEANESDIHNHGMNAPLSAAEDELVDVVIIGSGISGAVAAYMLQNDGNIRVKGKNRSTNTPSIVMLEAREACSGATGRNGGHCRPDVFAGFDRYSSIVGEIQASKVLKNEWETFQLIENIIEVERLDCDWWRGVTMSVFQSSEAMQASKTNFDSYKSYLEVKGEQLNQSLRFTENEEEARKLSRVKDAVGLATWPAGSLHPLRFVHGLLKVCLNDPNFKLFTHTPALSIEKIESDIWKITTTRGKIRARTVLLATNGYSLKLLPDLTNVLMPHRSQCTAIKPPLNFTQSMAFTTTFSIVKGPGNYEYITQQPSQDGPNPSNRIDGKQGSGVVILGGGHPFATRSEQIGTFDDTITNDKILEHLQSYPSKTFSNWNEEEGKLIHNWTGIQGYTRDSLPLVGPHFSKNQKGLFLNLGHHGHGMARAASCSRGIASLILRHLNNDNDQDSWEESTLLPKCYQWTLERSQRTDIDCRQDF